MSLPTTLYIPEKLSDFVTITKVNGGYVFEIRGKSNVFVSNTDAGAVDVDKIKYIGSKDKFPASSGGIITLESEYTYIITGDVDLTGDRLFCAGVVNIFGLSSETSSLTSTELGVGIALIQSDYTLILQNLTIIGVDTALNIDGTVSTVVCDWQNVVFNAVVNVGVVDSTENFTMTNCAFLSSNGLIITGTIGTVAFTTCLFSGNNVAANIIELDASCIITRRFRIVYSSVVVPALATGIDVNSLAVIPDESYILDTVNFAGAGTYISGLDQEENETLFINCVGIDNTSVNGQIYMNNNAVATTVLNTTDFYKAAGVTAASADNQRYTATDNRLTNNARIERKYLVIATLTFTSGNNNVCEFGLYDSKLEAVRTPSKTKSTANGTGRAENITMHCVVNHSNTDFIEVHVRNTTASNNITVVDLNLVITEII